MLRKLINDNLSKQISNKEDVAILFSGGMDSLSILLSCLDIGVKPILYTFYLKNYESDDIIYSRKISKHYGLQLNEIIIDDENIEQLEKDVTYIIKHFNVYLKTQVQCIYPFIYILPEIKEKYILTGLCADDLYGTCRSMAKLSKDINEFNKIRIKRVNNIHASSYFEIKQLCEEYKKNLIAPYKQNENIINLLMSLDYKQMNSPKQKNIMYQDYKNEIDIINIYRKNNNLQCGSKIRDFHDELLATKLNTKNHKAISGIYNNIYRRMKDGD